ncbi:MAG: endonuclease MutS2, partial [Candidatus Dadabacteria bacterium]
MATDLDRQTMLALDWPALLEALGDLARTALGRRRAGQLEPACDPEEASLLLETTEEALRLIEAGNGPAGLAEVADVVELLAACRRGEALEVEELRAVAGTVGGLAALARQLRSCGEGPRPLAPTLALWGRRLHLDPVLVDTLTGAFDERGGLSERTYPRLGELRREAAELERRARRSIEELLDSADFAEVLQDRYVTVRDGRFVVPIKAHAKSLGLGIVHDTSRSGQTVYLEPNQLVPLGNRRRLVEAEIAREELRIRRELSRLIGAQADAIEAAIEQAVAVDLAFARAELARRLDAVRPVVGREGTIALRAARHPLLVLQGADVVPNDLEVTAEHPVLVLTGPNAGGKTVALKTIGICALLVRSGCFVPAAEGSRVDFFDSVLADIGDRQSIAEGLSSFSGHLRNLREMVERAGPAALLLCDEIASGTDPSQGGALARALVERMAEAGARVVVTTHYAQLKAMGAADERVVVAAMEFHGGRPTYRARLGVAGESHALEIARETGIDPALVARARSLMDEGERALGDALRELERERTRAERLAAELAAER